MTSALLIVLMAAQAAAPVTGGPLGDKATQAREAGRVDEARGLYQKALAARPRWAEGWYFLGTILYDQDRGKECANAFARFTALEPKVSAGHALLGLCRYQTGDFGGALKALEQARQLGLPSGESLTDVASFHAAMLYTKAENFERALNILQIFTRREKLEPKAILLAGLAALRRPVFPAELPFEDRELVFRMGRAVLIASERRAVEAAVLFDEIAADFPKVPNVNYAHGTFLIGGDADKGLIALEKELEVQAEHLPTLVLIALEYLRRSDFAKAKEYGNRAVLAGPNHFTSHVVLGRAHVGLGELNDGIRELELAVKLEPTSPQIRIALASAYQKAGRAQEAARERNEFQRLKQVIEAGR